MASLEELEEEIKGLEGQFGNHSNEESAEQGEQVEENAETPEENREGDFNASTEDVTETVNNNNNTPSQDDAQPAVEQAKKKRTDWKKRFINLKASHDSTVFKLRSDLSKATERNVSLEKQIITLKSDLSTLRSKSTDIYKDVFSEEEMDIVGEDTISTLKKATKVAVDSAVTPLKAQLEEERKQRLKALEEDSFNHKKAAENLFLSKLEAAVEDYKEIDTDPKFLEWMNELDNFSGLTKKVLFKQAQANGDVYRVAEFFNEFKKIKNKGKEILERKVTPESTSSSSSNQRVAQQNKPTVISRQYIDDFYNAAIKGKFKGREKERLEIERSIDQAIMEGRVTS